MGTLRAIVAIAGMLLVAYIVGFIIGANVFMP